MCGDSSRSQALDRSLSSNDLDPCSRATARPCRKYLLCPSHVLAGSQIRFAEQPIYLTRVEPVGVAFGLEPRLRLAQEVERLAVTSIRDTGIREQSQGICLVQQGTRGPLLFQPVLHLGNAFFEFALAGMRPSPQDQAHGKIVHELVRLAHCDRRVGVLGDGSRVTTELVHTQADGSCHGLAERMIARYRHERWPPCTFAMRDQDSRVATMSCRRTA